MTDEQIENLKALATNACDLSFGQGVYWARVCLQLIEELEKERAKHE